MKENDNMNRVAFACPLYDMKNHFELALNLYKSKMKYKINNDLYFVFSNIEQKNRFFNKLKELFPKDELKYLVIPETYNDYKAKAVSKKFYALDKLKEKYDYIILVDCESLFIKYCDFGALAEYIWNNRTMLNANKSIDGFFIMRSCFKTMGLYKNKKLIKDTKYYSFNFWFNELQVYKCEYLYDFFKWLDLHNRENVYNNYSCFEYYVFYAYLLLQHDYRIKRFNYSSFGGINEYLFRFKLESQKKILKDMDLHWSSTRDGAIDSTVMLFHLDREQNANDYNTDNMKSRLKLKVKRYLYIIKDIIFN